jgi:peptidoglycan/xylan/chitin deacetylase (PgdA/CDA1 family)
MIAFSNQNQRQPPPVKWLPVLMYHRVVDIADRPDPFQINVRATDFEAQLAYLRRRGYQSIGLDEVPLAVSDASPWRKPIAITFDDGYRDNYTHALPLLKKYGHTATIMLVSERIGGRNDWDLGMAESAPLLCLEEIREMERSGIRFGAHTATHPSLPDISLEQVRSELAGSKLKLEQLLGHEVSTLAYPYGRYTPEVCRIAAEAGFAAAFSVQPRCHSMHSFSRIDAAAFKGDTPLWRLSVSGAYYRLKRLRVLRALNYVRKRGIQSVARRCRNPETGSSEVKR